MAKRRGKLTEEAKDIIGRGIGANLPLETIQAQVLEQTGKNYTKKQIHGYKNILTGIANGPKVTLGGVAPITPAGIVLQTSAPPPPGTPPPLTKPNPAPPYAETFPQAPAASALPPEELPPVQTHNVRVEYDVYRKDPSHGYIGRIQASHAEPMGAKLIGEKLGDGLYDIYKYVNGQRGGHPWMDVRVSGHGAPRYLNGQTAMGSPYHRLSFDGQYGQQNFQGQGQGQPWGPGNPNLQDPTTQFHNIYNVADKMAERMGGRNGGNEAAAAVNSSLGFANNFLQQQQQQAATAGAGNKEFLQQWMVMQDRKGEEEGRRRAQEKQDREQAWEKERTRTQEDFDRRETAREQEYKRQKDRDEAEATRRKDQDREFFSQIRTMEKERADNLTASTKEAETARTERVNEIKDDLKNQGEAVKAELKDQVETIQSFYEGQHKAKSELLQETKRHNEQIFELQKKNLEDKQTDGVIARTVSGALEKVSSGFERAMTMKTINELPEGERGKLLMALNHLQPNGNGAANGNGAPANESHNGTEQGGIDVAEQLGQASIDKVLKSDFFQSLQEEWAVDVEGGMGPYMFVGTFMQYMKQSPSMFFFGKWLVPRPWTTTIEVMRPHLKTAVRKVFETKEAGTFYEEFRILLNDNVRLSMQQASEVIRAKGVQPTPEARPEPTTDAVPR